MHRGIIKIIMMYCLKFYGNDVCVTSKSKIHKPMKKTNLLIVLLLTFSVFAFAQSAIINQLDSLGRKDGKWQIYLDKDWAKLTDSTKALYFRYTFFDHGVNIYPMGPCGKKGYKLQTASSGKLLNGEYKWYDAKGHLSSVHIFNDGEYISCKEYFPGGELSQHFDYTKKCEGESHGWTVFCYNKKGDLILVSPTCRNEKGKWPVMRD